MNIMKELFIEEYEAVCSEFEESSKNITCTDDAKICELANQRAIDRFADMCDEAKERAKYES